MPLVPGVITVNADGSHSFDLPDSAAEAIFDVGWDAYVAALAAFDQPVPTNPAQLAGVKRGLAGMSTMFSAYTTYLKENGTADGDPIE